MDETIKKYGDIINLPHYKSKKRPPMIMIDRAAQFAPFAALTGHQDAIIEEGRYVENFVELTDEEKAELDKKLAYLMKNFSHQPEICITYFEFDDKKQGGEYKKVQGKIKKLKLYERQVVMQGGIVIPIENVCNISGENLDNNDF